MKFIIKRREVIEFSKWEAYYNYTRCGSALDICGSPHHLFSHFEALFRSD